MKSNKLLTKFGGLAVASFTRAWMGTLDYRAALYDPTIDPIRADFPGPVIFVFWHEYILAPFYLRGNCNIAMLLSRHNDAEWLSEAARHMGFRTVRGSTNRGGVQALREMLRASQSMNLAITPDGPRGPRRKLAPGAVYLASRLRIPIVALGFGYDRPWRVQRAWDRFAVPRPYSRVRSITSPLLHIPDQLDRDGLEVQRQRVESMLEFVTSHSEQWARSGSRMAEQIVVQRSSRPLALRASRAA